MRIRPHVSKSSVENFEGCQHKYFLEYNLGYRSDGSLKTNIGSAVHSVIECLGLMKLEIQRHKKGEPNQKYTITDDLMGTWEFTEDELYVKRMISDSEVNAINASRANKTTYIDQKKIKPGYSRRGEDLINRLAEKAKQVHLSDNMKPAEIRDYYNFIWMTLDEFDVRDYNVIAVEQNFDLEIAEDWAKLDDGGYVRIKGFVDLIVEIDGAYHIFDWKTGQRKDFNTGKVKTLRCLKEDLQLAMYSYALSQLYPSIPIIANILYTRDGGLFTVIFDETVEKLVHHEVRKHVEAVRATEIPMLRDPKRYDYRCKNMCHFAKKNTFDDNICDCQFIASKIRELGLDQVEKEYSKPKEE